MPVNQHVHVLLGYHRLLQLLHPWPHQTAQDERILFTTYSFPSSISGIQFFLKRKEERERGRREKYEGKREEGGEGARYHLASEDPQAVQETSLRLWVWTGTIPRRHIGLRYWTFLSLCFLLLNVPIPHRCWWLRSAKAPSAKKGLVNLVHFTQKPQHSSGRESAFSGSW